MDVREGLRYSKDHEWVEMRGTVARVGITDYAQDALGDVVFVQLPDVGRTVAASEGCSEVESTKSVSDIYAPVAGTVAAVNARLGAEPHLLNADPYGEGWLFEIETAGAPLPSDLMDAAGYRALVGG
jgi:glycine cleavage system H protein